MTRSSPSERVVLVVGWAVVLAIVLAVSATLRQQLAREAAPEPPQLASVLPTEHADAYGDDVGEGNDTGRADR